MTWRSLNDVADNVVDVVTKNPLACPKCKQAAQPGPAAQVCPKCRTAFVLLAGPALDPSVKPPAPDPTAKEIKVLGAAVAMRYRCTLTADGIQRSDLDPVVGHLALDTKDISWRGIHSVALWRKPDWPLAVVSTFGLGIFALPLTALAAEETSWIVAAFALLFWALLAYVLHGALVRRANKLRVVGDKWDWTIRFDRPARRRLRFLAALLERGGFPDVEMP